MKSKAICNLEVAQSLINSQKSPFCTISVHCSYYAVLQYMKHILANTERTPIPYEKQKSRAEQQSSHEYILGEVRQRISDCRTGKEFARQVRLLKQKRIIADYEIGNFSVEESLECRNLAEGLIAKLKSCFGNI
ncbi:hypothetical protein SAMN02745171_00540 [Porphyromonas circumdentaria]|uniref:HEPN domain-containing protein n=1 Tax=Porphyromonas circumdentaria TaxID=29524 RepID=A0A1T4LUQ3_9PORP|nr:hypothetical protein SAMN02745171_00540 [Porphyromonas circumdentaria]